MFTYFKSVVTGIVLFGGLAFYLEAAEATGKLPLCSQTDWAWVKKGMCYQPHPDKPTVHNSNKNINNVHSKNRNSNENTNKNSSQSEANARSRSNSHSRAISTNTNTVRSGDVSSDNSNKLKNVITGGTMIIEGDYYPEIAAAVGSVYPNQCSVSVSGGGITGSVSTSFDDPKCEAWMQADRYQHKFLAALEIARTYMDAAGLLTMKADKIEQEFNDSLIKGAIAIEPEAVRLAKANAVRSLDFATQMYDKALDALVQRDSWEARAEGIIKRSVFFGQIGGTVARILPIAAVAKAFNKGE